MNFRNGKDHAPFTSVFVFNDEKTRIPVRHFQVSREHVLFLFYFYEFLFLLRNDKLKIEVRRNALTKLKFISGDV